MRTFLQWAAKGALLTYTIHEHVLFITKTQGPSMLPTFNLYGDIMICEAVSPRFQLLGPGDVIICNSPRDPNKFIIKRIVGMPGDVVTYRRKSDFWVDSHIQQRVPEGKVWLQGDNLYESIDSRDYGPVPLSLIRGRVVLKIWPYYEFGPVPSTSQHADDADN